MTVVPFEVQSDELEGGITVISVRGELDMSTAPELEKSLGEAQSSDARVILDLSECDFIDSTGIALIVRSWQRIDRGAGREGSGRLVVQCVNHQVRRLLKITGIESTISLHQERDDALAELRG